MLRFRGVSRRAMQLFNTKAVDGARIIAGNHRPFSPCYFVISERVTLIATALAICPGMSMRAVRRRLCVTFLDWLEPGPCCF